MSRLSASLSIVAVAVIGKKDRTARAKACRGRWDRKFRIVKIWRLANEILACLILDVARQHLAPANMIGLADHAFDFHAFDEPGSAVVADL